MIRRIVFASAAAAAFALSGFIAAPANADTVPTYTCDQVDDSGPGDVAGIGNCWPSYGAVPMGPFQGQSLIIGRNGARFACHFGGFARTPVHVFARSRQPGYGPATAPGMAPGQGAAPGQEVVPAPRSI